MILHARSAPKAPQIIFLYVNSMCKFTMASIIDVVMCVSIYTDAHGETLSSYFEKGESDIGMLCIITQVLM